MKIAKHTVATLTYELRADAADGELIEKTTEQNPLVALFGANNLIEEFEKGLSGKTAGEAFALEIKSENAYGLVDEGAIRELPREHFTADDPANQQLLAEGERLEIQDEHGHVYHPLVVAVSKETVTLDFNHPLSGRDLFFTGKVQQVRPASAEEIAHGHVHGPAGHHH